MRLVLFAGVALVLAAPGVARADHVTAAVSVELRDDGPGRDGTRKATLSWSITCSPGAEAAGDARIMIRPKNPGLAPRVGDELEIDPAQPSSSAAVTLDPGRTVHGAVTATCTQFIEDADGEAHEHRATASADSAQTIFVPPRLGKPTVGYGSWCDAERARRRGHLQALQSYRLGLPLRFNSFSLLRGRGRASYREIVVRASGAGLRLRERVLVNRNGFGVNVRPRRAGRLRIWVELGGVTTNRQTITVAAIRGGCRRAALLHPF